MSGASCVWPCSGALMAQRVVAIPTNGRFVQVPFKTIWPSRRRVSDDSESTPELSLRKRRDGRAGARDGAGVEGVFWPRSSTGRSRSRV